MYHSITIGEKNTWDDWHLIPLTRPLFNPPPVKTNYVEIPGGDGSLDLSTVLTGRPVYGDRTGSWSFYVENGFMPWFAVYSDIMVYLHGERLRAVLEDDPDYYYEGRFSVNSWKSDKERSTITIDYTVGPYKMAFDDIGNKWLWDPFNFTKDVIRYYKNLVVTGSLKVDVIGDMIEVVPTIITSASGMTVTFEGKKHTLKKGNNVIPEIVIRRGTNVFTFTGNGTVTIDVRGGGKL